MPSDWKEDAIHHKYDPLPDEPRHRKKAKKRYVRSDHKHEYEEIAIDAGTYTISSGERRKNYHKGMRCRVCGRLHNVRFWNWREEPPEDLPLYKVDGMRGLFAKELGEERRVR